MHQSGFKALSIAVIALQGLFPHLHSNFTATPKFFLGDEWEQQKRRRTSKLPSQLGQSKQRNRFLCGVPPKTCYRPRADPSSAHEQIVTPWDVQGSVSSDGQQLAIDYDKLVDQFGTRRIDAALLERFERLTGHRPHILLRRGMFFSHRWVLDLFLRGDRMC